MTVAVAGSRTSIRANVFLGSRDMASWSQTWGMTEEQTPTLMPARTSHGSLNKDMGIDTIDARLLRLLEGDSRTSTADLARALAMSAPSVAERLKRLEEAGVIRRFTVEINPAALATAWPPTSAFGRRPVNSIRSSAPL